MAIDAQTLRNVPFLASLKDREVRQLAGSMRERTVPAGADVVTQGTGAIAFFIMLDGEATVIADDHERGTLRRGDHFGEIALVLPDTDRTATVRAATDVRVALLTTWNFRAFVAEHPAVTWSLLETLARRVAGTPGT